jgi:hypothetical protein
MNAPSWAHLLFENPQLGGLSDTARWRPGLARVGFMDVGHTEAGNAPASPVTVEGEPEMAFIVARLHGQLCGVIV